MSNVIRFLEAMGNQAQWGDAAGHDLELALADARVEGELRSAIVDKDVARLQALLQQKPLIGFVSPAEEPDEEEEDGEEEPDEKEARRSRSISLACQP